MSISNLSISQRLKEQKRLKFLLAGGLIASSILHLGVGLSNSPWGKKDSRVAEEPIEFIVVDAPKPPMISVKPVEQPKAIATPRTIKLKPPEEVTTTKIIRIQEPVREIEPEVVKPKVAKNIPPEPKPIPVIREPEPVTESEPEPEASPTEPQELKLSSNKPRRVNPTSSQNSPNRSPINQSDRNPQTSNNNPTRRVSPSTNRPIKRDNTPGGGSTNRTIVRNNTGGGSLQRSRGNRNFRDNLGDGNNSNATPGGNEGNNTPGSGGTNRTIARNNTGGGSLQRSGGNRNFRDNLGDGNNSNATPGGNEGNNTPGSGGTNRTIVRNNTGGGSLQRSGGNRNFRDNLGDGNNSNTPGGNEGDNTPGGGGNNQPIARNNTGGGSLQRSGGNRNFRDNLGDGNNSNTGSEGNGSGDGEQPGDVAANRTPPGNQGNSGGAFSQTEVSCLRNCQPKYPKGLKKVQARPVVRIEMTADGKPTDASIVTSSGYPELDDAVREMALRMEFSPPGRTGTLRLKFNLPQG
jgi:TonB family protein